jgi:hypothetical protein
MRVKLQKEEELNQIEREKQIQKEKELEKLKIENELKIKQELRIQKQKEEKERREIVFKENVKRKILENERNKQLENEAIEELIEKGLIDNNHYSGKNIRQSIPSDVKISVFERDKGKCVNCSSNTNLEFDHIIPVSKGGANTINNLQLLCMSCNRKKSNKII